MKRPAFVPCAVTCALLLLAASPSRADPIPPIGWSEVWRAPASVLADNGLGSVSFGTGWTSQPLQGSSEVIATSLQPIYSPPFGPPPFVPPPGPVPGPGPFPGLPGPITLPGPATADPAVFNHDPFNLLLFIQDADSNIVKHLTFHGVLNGSFSPQGSNLDVSISDPTQTLHIGVHLYKVTIDHITLGLPGDPAGSISAHVAVSHNPEPSSLVIALLGGSGLGLTYWRRRRARCQAGLEGELPAQVLEQTV